MTIVTKAALLAKLRELQRDGDPESAHIEVDKALLVFIADPEVTKAFEAITRWYA